MTSISFINGKNVIGNINTSIDSIDSEQMASVFKFDKSICIINGKRYNTSELTFETKVTTKEGEEMLIGHREPIHVTWENVNMENVSLRTSSGDLHIEIKNSSAQEVNTFTQSGSSMIKSDQHVEMNKISTQSGDIDVRATSVRVNVAKTMSGNISATGEIDSASTMSGDVIGCKRRK